MNTMGVTMSYLGRLTPAQAFDKLSTVVTHNLEALHLQIRHVASRPLQERLHRMVSDLLPGYTYPACKAFYQDKDLQTQIEEGFAAIGEEARSHHIRLSLHPGQFCVIASQNETASTNGIAEFEYHANIMRWMGYGEGWHPGGAHINIHAGARAVGIDGFREGLSRLSQTARNLITVENDEVSYGLDTLLPLSDKLPIVLDLHHHWIESQGEYIEPDDPRIKRILDSWRDVRPVSHISVSQESLLPTHPKDQRPDFHTLIESGLRPKDLRAHSDMMWNTAVNELVSRHLAWTDFEVEAKAKNLASEQLSSYVKHS